MPNKKDLGRYFEGFTILDGEGSISINEKKDWDSPIYIGIATEGGSYHPGGVIYVADYGTEDGALQAAVELLEESDRFKSDFQRIEKELYDEAIKEGLSEDDASTQAYEWARENETGEAFTLTAREAFELISNDERASKFISLDVGYADQELFQKEAVTIFEKAFSLNFKGNEYDSSDNKIRLYLTFGSLDYSDDSNQEIIVTVGLYASEQHGLQMIMDSNHPELFNPKMEEILDWDSFDDVHDFRKKVTAIAKKFVNKLDNDIYDFKQLQRKTREELDSKESSMQRKGDYQGWKNYPTWNFALWIDNDKGTSDYVFETFQSEKFNAYKMADFLEAMAEEGMPETSGTYVDILGWGIKQIDFRQIAERLIAERLIAGFKE